MELIVEPDIYSPSIDELGNYVDKIPSYANLQNGLRCPCGSRKDKTYDTHTIFRQHIKTTSHQKWLSNLNLNKANYYIENEKLKEVIQNQKLIIAKLEKDINSKSMTIDYLTQHLNRKSNSNIVENLLEFD